MTPYANVLILEDDSHWQNIFYEITHDENLRPTIVSGLNAAYIETKRRAFDLAILDMSLNPQDHANQDGMQLLDHLSQRQPRPQVIIVTGFGTLDMAIKAFVNYNVVDFVKKENFNRRKFRETIHKALALIPPRLEGLTRRERQVLHLLANGYTNRQIAETLVLSPNTIKKHVYHIFKKLGVDNRAAATAKALQAGLASEYEPDPTP
ncbi:MAG: LuxR C-terminal-related transcriptional regulator [Anaerolineae bacterium]